MFLYYLQPFLILLTLLLVALLLNLLTLGIKCLLNGLIYLLRGRSAYALVLGGGWGLGFGLFDGLSVLIGDVIILICPFVRPYYLWGGGIDRYNVLSPAELREFGKILWGQIFLGLFAGFGVLGLCNHPNGADKFVLVFVLDSEVLLPKFFGIVAEYPSIAQRPVRFGKLHTGYFAYREKSATVTLYEGMVGTVAFNPKFAVVLPYGAVDFLECRVADDGSPMSGTHRVEKRNYVAVRFPYGVNTRQRNRTLVEKGYGVSPRIIEFVV